MFNKDLKINKGKVSLQNDVFGVVQSLKYGKVLTHYLHLWGFSPV